MLSGQVLGTKSRNVRLFLRLSFLRTFPPHVPIDPHATAQQRYNYCPTIHTYLEQRIHTDIHIASAAHHTLVRK